MPGDLYHYGRIKGRLVDLSQHISFLLWKMKSWAVNALMMGAGWVGVVINLVLGGLGIFTDTGSNEMGQGYDVKE